MFVLIIGLINSELIEEEEVFGPFDSELAANDFAAPWIQRPDYKYHTIKEMKS